MFDHLARCVHHDEEKSAAWSARGLDEWWRLHRGGSCYRIAADKRDGCDDRQWQIRRLLSLSPRCWNLGHETGSLAQLGADMTTARMMPCARHLAARQGKARQGKARQGKARQGKARQGKARQGKARQGKARQGKARQGKARQGKARQGKARQGKARQGKARQGKARQGKARQGKLSARVPTSVLAQHVKPKHNKKQETASRTHLHLCLPVSLNSDLIL